MPRIKPLLSASRFEDIFSGHEPHQQGRKPVAYRSGSSQSVSSYCTLRSDASAGSMSVTPNQETIDAIFGSMIEIGYDTIHFSIIVHDDGTASVRSCYGTIIGSRLLAEIDAETIPDGYFYN